MTEYSVDEVRARFEAWMSAQPWLKATIGLARSSGEYADPCINSRWQGWQAAYAERIQADAVAVPVGEVVRPPKRRNDPVGASVSWYGRRPAAGTKLFTRPPAQAAQVELPTEMSPNAAAAALQEKGNG